MWRFDVEVHKSLGRAVPKIEGDDDDCVAMNCGCHDVPIIPIRQLNRVDEMLVSCHQPIGQCVIYQLPVSFRENLDTGGPFGRALVIIIGAIAELERNLIIERFVPVCAVPGSKDDTSDASR